MIDMSIVFVLITAALPLEVVQQDAATDEPRAQVQHEKQNEPTPSRAHGAQALEAGCCDSTLWPAYCDDYCARLTSRCGQFVRRTRRPGLVLGPPPFTRRGPSRIVRKNGANRRGAEAAEQRRRRGRDAWAAWGPGPPRLPWPPWLLRWLRWLPRR